MNSSSRCYRSKSILRKSCLSVLVAFALMNQVSAQQPAQATQYTVPAGDLVKSVNEISRSSGVQIVYDIELLRGLKAGEVTGSLTLEQALLPDVMLAYEMDGAPISRPPPLFDPPTYMDAPGCQAVLR